jgi:hypothetical protein
MIYDKRNDYPVFNRSPKLILLGATGTPASLTL